MIPLWHPMETAPHDRPIIVYCPEKHGLPAMASICQWQFDAGFCVDELRDPTCWIEIPSTSQEKRP